MSAGRRLYSHIIQVKIGDVIKQRVGCNQVATPTNATPNSSYAILTCGPRATAAPGPGLTSLCVSMRRAKCRRLSSSIVSFRRLRRPLNPQGLPWGVSRECGTLSGGHCGIEGQTHRGGTRKLKSSSIVQRGSVLPAAMVGVRCTHRCSVPLPVVGRGCVRR